MHIPQCDSASALNTNRSLRFSFQLCVSSVQLVLYLVSVYVCVYITMNSNTFPIHFIVYSVSINTTFFA